MRFLRRLSDSPDRSRSAQGPAGSRAYAIGDIHGRLDLLEKLLDKVEADARGAPVSKIYIVFLGDLIDRGPDSAGVLERLSAFSPPYAKPVFIAGNHEEVLLRVLAGETGVVKDWLRFGGAECVESYGLDPGKLKKAEPAEAIARLRAAIPRSHQDFLESFADTFRFGDYLFVHAGLRPGIDLADQDQFDLRWIREPFLSCEDDHGLVVVHGHTIVPEVVELANRICIDTGAYYSGTLTAIALEGRRRWYLSETSTTTAPSTVMGS